MTTPIDKFLLEQYKEGLIISTACLGGEIPQAIIKDKIEVENLINFQKNIKNINQVYSEIWESKEIKDFQISKEESLRGKDKKFSNCLYLEFTNGNDAVFLMDDAKSIFNEAEIGAYQLISTLT